MPNPVILRSSILATLLFVLATSVGAQEEVQTIEFHSPAVERMMKYNIVLPASYDSSQERYPVLYLLHGLTSNYIAWSRMGAAFYAGLVDDLIIVMPDVGNSWYVNWDENGEGQRNNWEDHIIMDVIGHVDTNFRTIARREARAINGLSMGGYGGLTLGFAILSCSFQSGAPAVLCITPGLMLAGCEVKFSRGLLGPTSN